MERPVGKVSTRTSREDGGLAARILAVSWALPPMQVPRATQVDRVARALSALGHDLTIVHAATESEHLATLGADTYRRIAIDERADIKFGRHRWRFDRGSACVPAGERRWFGSALAEIRRLLSEEPFDVLLTFSMPWSDHVVGLRVASAFDIPWIAHFSDPWRSNSYIQGRSALAQWKADRSEAAVIKNADAVAFTNTHSRDAVMSAYNKALVKKTFIVPHGYDFAGLTLGSRPQEWTDKIVILHSGNVYGRRSINPVLDALARLGQSERARLLIVFVGTVPNDEQVRCRDMRLSGSVHFLPAIPPNDAARLAALADVLLLIEAPDPIGTFLPSKLIEYVGIGRPILALSPTTGAAADVLKETGGRVVEPDNIELIAQCLRDALEKNGRPIGSGTPHTLTAQNETANKYHYRTTGAIFDRIIQDVTALSYERNSWSNCYFRR